MHLVFAVYLALALGVTAPLRVPGALSTRIANYQIDARLDESTHDVRGTTRLRWRNTGTAPARVLPFHLYMNAFASERTRFFEPAWRWSPTPALHGDGWGYEEVGEARVSGTGRAEEHARLTSIEDGSVATLTLTTPVAPGDTVEIELPFVTHLPSIVSRAGASDGFYAVGQWFPKIGVYRCDPDCAFAAAPYYADSEFYADFGEYEVTLDLPSRLVVGATGVLIDSREEGDRRHLRYRAEDVHDFAWSADARFVAHTEEVDDGSGLPPVTVTLLGAPSQAENIPRHMNAIRVGLTELGARLGPYPYHQLTVVQPPAEGAEASGMEYPTFFYTKDEPLPTALEHTTVHELAHQWFQGMIASDEVEDPWLDEGLTQTATGWVVARLERARGGGGFLGHDISVPDFTRAIVGEEDADALSTPAYRFRDTRSYSRLVYFKTTLLMETLRRRMGDPAFFAAMRRYADATRFTHPRPAQLLAAFADAPAPLRALLERVVAAPGALDYAVTSVRTAKARAPEGRERSVAQAAPAGAAYYSEVVVEALGDLRLPVTVRAYFADGGHADRVLPAGTPSGPRWQRLSFESASALRGAELYPDDDTPLDTHVWNDGQRVAPDRGPRRRIVSSLRLLLAALVGWVAR
jgi:hypothetical protein